MADDSNDTQAKIDEDDRELRQREDIRDPEAKDRDKFTDAESGFPGGRPAGAVGSRGEDSEYGPQSSNEEPAEEEETDS
jgi:hypothetical protein